MKIAKHRIVDNIYLLKFKTQRNLASTFLRFQEYHESPEFRGKIFTLKEFKKWYSGGKKFTYHTDWDGFNIPSYVLKPFYAGKFNPLSAKERRLLSLFKNLKSRFYIIGVHEQKKNESRTLKHEIAHGLFYTVPEYKKEVEKELKTFSLKRVKKELCSTQGYCKEVLEDEINAYSIGGSKRLSSKIPKRLKERLKKAYKKYSKPSSSAFHTTQ